MVRRIRGRKDPVLNIDRRQWSYDRINRWLLSEVERHQQEVTLFEAGTPQDVKIEALRTVLTGGKPEETDFLQSLLLADDAKITQMLEIKKSDANFLEERRSRMYESLSQSEVFIFGPATIDSLLDEPPKTYEYLINSRLPFPKMYFELLDPMEWQLPLRKNTFQFLGFTLEPTKGASAKDRLKLLRKVHGNAAEEKFEECAAKEQAVGPGYRINTFLERAGAITTFDFSYHPVEQSIFTGHIDSLDEFYLFMKDEEATVIPYTDEAKEMAPLSAGRTPLSWIPGSSGFLRIANLATNLVNYINAHNVTIISRERRVRRNVPVERGNRDRGVRPFHLVVVKDEESEYSGPGAPTWTLEWRVYVRGHNRRQRNEEGLITRTSWISPFVKGPHDAPWREHRYQVLYDKLEREKEMIRIIQGN
ncbi:hypothetical protein CMO91_04715 [Candidatus Woesearchaeota archaeon]|nr:hypothetical protein [Candidatus Woesearchaeota archaeon]